CSSSCWSTGCSRRGTERTGSRSAGDGPRRPRRPLNDTGAGKPAPVSDAVRRVDSVVVLLADLVDVDAVRRAEGVHQGALGLLPLHLDLVPGGDQTETAVLVLSALVAAVPVRLHTRAVAERDLDRGVVRAAHGVVADGLGEVPVDLVDVDDNAVPTHAHDGPAKLELPELSVGLLKLHARDRGEGHRRGGGRRRGRLVPVLVALVVVPAAMGQRNRGG